MTEQVDVVWTDQVEPYAKTLSRRAKWRFIHLGYESEDFIQEVFFVYQRCLIQYRTVLGDNGLLTSEFKRGVINMLTDLSLKATTEREFLLPGDGVSGVPSDS